jgi:hypothetical protein
MAEDDSKEKILRHESGVRAISPTSTTCSNCLFFCDHLHDEEIGLCQRFPPKYEEGDRESVNSFGQPLVYGFGWCGEFKSIHQERRIHFGRHNAGRTIDLQRIENEENEK